MTTNEATQEVVGPVLLRPSVLRLRHAGMAQPAKRPRELARPPVETLAWTMVMDWLAKLVARRIIERRKARLVAQLWSPGPVRNAAWASGLFDDTRD